MLSGPQIAFKSWTCTAVGENNSRNLKDKTDIMGTRCSSTFQQLMKSPMSCFFWPWFWKRHSYSLLIIMILRSSRIHQMHPPKKTRGHFQRGAVWWGETVPTELGETWMFDTKLSSSVVFWPQGHVICCCSLGSLKDRSAELMFPNMITALNVGTIQCEQKEGCDQHVTWFTKTMVCVCVCAVIIALQFNILSVKQFV